MVLTSKGELNRLGDDENPAALQMESAPVLSCGSNQTLQASSHPAASSDEFIGEDLGPEGD